MFHFGNSSDRAATPDAAEARLNALARMVHMLLREVSTNPIRAEKEEYDRFYSSLVGMECELGAHPDAQQILILAGSATKVIEDYNHHTARFLASRQSQIATLLVDKLASMPDVSAAQSAQLRRLVAHEFEIPQLTECLATIKPANKPATVPVRASRRLEAESAIAGAQRIGGCFAAAIALGRIPLIANRWGPELADSVMQSYSDELQLGLTPADHVFRWSPGSLLLLLSRTVPLVVVRGELNRILPHHLERNFETAGRSVLLRVEAASSLWRLDPAESLDTAVQRIEAFLAIHLPVS